MKICAIFTGGTIGSELSENGYIDTDENKRFQLIDLYQKRYNSRHEFVTRCPYYMLSENLDAKHINLLIQEIELALKAGYDCILVMHGTDTLCYTAAAISLLYEGSDMPIILVSANYPLSDERSNGLENFAYAVKFAEFVISDRSNRSEKSDTRSPQSHHGVYISYSDPHIDGLTPRIHKGQYVLEQQFMSALINSIDGMYYGEYETAGVNHGNTYTDEDYHRKAETDECCCFEKLNFRVNPDYRDTFLCRTISDLRDRVSRSEDMSEGIYLPEKCPVLRVFAYPGITYPVLTPDIKYVLIKGYHSGTLSCDDALKMFCAQCRMKGVSVYLAGLREGENAYESTSVYDELGIKPLFNMTDITAFMFLWFSAGLD